jgi:hypothetical protein
MTIAVSSGSARALVIVPSFDTTLTSQSNAVALEAAINTAASTISGLYSNAGTVDVLFKFDNSVLGESTTDGDFVPYTSYVSQLGVVSAANPGNHILSTAVANISKGNTGNWVLGTTAMLRVGQGYFGVTPCFNAAGNSVSGCNAIYDGVITIGAVSTASAGAGFNSQAVVVVEHEMNEILGGGGPASTIGYDFSAEGKTGVLGSTDLYRYQSSGPTCADVDSTPSYTTSSSAVACYSYDGGSTSLVRMNQAGGGSDYADFATTTPNTPYIQDAFYPGTTPVYSPLSPEFVMMQSLGWEAVPEPSTMPLFGGAIGGLSWLRRRRFRPA